MKIEYEENCLTLSAKYKIQEEPEEKGTKRKINREFSDQNHKRFRVHSIGNDNEEEKDIANEILDEENDEDQEGIASLLPVEVIFFKYN